MHSFGYDGNQGLGCYKATPERCRDELRCVFFLWHLYFITFIYAITLHGRLPLYAYSFILINQTYYLRCLF